MIGNGWYEIWSATDLWVSEDGESEIVGPTAVLFASDDGELCLELRDDTGQCLMIDLHPDWARTLAVALSEAIER